jgi:SAM-dependent methyltransferase
MGFGIYDVYRFFQPKIRQHRFRLFMDLLRPEPTARILDVGGYYYDWIDRSGVTSPVTLLNVSYPVSQEPIPNRFTCLVGDGRSMQFADRSFDIVFSNSVIEHVGSFADQERFASEVRRVGKRLFVQTPNRWFFLEPHFIAPFVHFLPRGIARRVLPLCSFRAWFRGGDNADLKSLATELRLLSYLEMKRLFPDCEIHRERWFGLTKSFIAVRSGS